MGCSKCKKPKEIKVSPNDVQKIELDIYVPTIEEIVLAYHELTSYKGVQEDKKEFISKVYNVIFKEELIYDCNSCVSTQARKFKHYITNVLKVSV
jgi:hypothetical protein